MLLKNMMQIKKKKVISAVPSTSIVEVMDILIKNNIGCLPVTGDEDKLIGIVSERDVLSRIHLAGGDYTTLTVKDLMTTELIVGSPDDDIANISDKMNEHKIRHMPIIKDEKVVGLISLWEIYQTRMENMTVENRQLSHMLHGRDKTGDYDDHY